MKIFRYIELFALSVELLGEILGMQALNETYKIRKLPPPHGEYDFQYRIDEFRKNKNDILNK